MLDYLVAHASQDQGTEAVEQLKELRPRRRPVPNVDGGPGKIIDFHPRV